MDIEYQTAIGTRKSVKREDIPMLKKPPYLRFSQPNAYPISPESAPCPEANNNEEVSPAGTFARISPENSFQRILGNKKERLIIRKAAQSRFIKF